MENNSQESSVLNTNQSKDSITGMAESKYEEHVDNQKKEALDEYVGSTQETPFLKDTRITDVPNTSTNTLDQIHIDTEAVLGKADGLSTLNQNMVDEFDKVIQKMSTLEGEWTASACGNAMSSFNILKEHLSARSTQMNNYINLIKKVIVSGYEDTETNNSNLADAFK